MYIVVFITAKNVNEGKKIAQNLVKERLAACVNILPGVKSIFTWKGKVDKADEALLIVKSKRSCFSKIVGRVRELHSYDVPEIIALPIAAGHKDYLDWIKDSVA